MQQMGSSGEAASRRSSTRRSTGPWSTDQHILLADDSTIRKDTAYGQMRTSLTALAEDPYWQQKRDERKDSLQQKGLLGIPEMHEAGGSASIATTDFIALALSQTYQAKSNSSATAPTGDAGTQSAFEQGSIAALHRPSRASQQDATLRNGSDRMQADHVSPEAGSMHQHPRQGSAVKLALEEVDAPHDPAQSVDVPEVRQLACLSLQYCSNLQGTHIPMKCLAALERHAF